MPGKPARPHSPNWPGGLARWGVCSALVSLVIDDSRAQKKGTASVGVAFWHCCGLTGDVLSEAGDAHLGHWRAGHAFIGRCLYLPEEWTSGRRVGLAQYQVRTWALWHRHITACMPATAFLAVQRAAVPEPESESDAGQEPPPRKARTTASHYHRRGAPSRTTDKPAPTTDRSHRSPTLKTSGRSTRRERAATVVGLP